MIAIAVMAPMLVVYVWFRDLGRALDDFYGPHGKLNLENRISSECSAGFARSVESRYLEAEAHYRLALELDDDLQATLARNDWHAHAQTSEILLGLAESLAKQGRYPKAASLLEQRAALKPIVDEPATSRDLLNRAKSLRAKLEDQGDRSASPDPYRTGHIELNPGP
jgi:thioredoxin-like negative regulator of GroEL